MSECDGKGDRNRIAASESCRGRVRIMRSADLEAAQINHKISALVISNVGGCLSE